MRNHNVPEAQPDPSTAPEDPGTRLPVVSPDTPPESRPRAPVPSAVPDRNEPTPTTPASTTARDTRRGPLRAGLAALSLLGLTLMSGLAPAAQDAALPEADATFLKHAAKGGMLEVELGKLAASRAQNAKVKNFGQRMVDDHGAVNQRLEALLRKKGIDKPTAPDDEGEAKKAKLNGAPPEKFDATYVDMMREDHEKDVADFSDKAKSASDADVRRFAEESLPLLKSHLESVKALDAYQKH